MNAGLTNTHHIAYDTTEESSTSRATMLLIFQILTQLDVLKRCRGGWKAIADTAKEEVKTLHLRIEKESNKYKQLEYEYNLKMSSLVMKIQRAYDEKNHVKSILSDTEKQLQKLQIHSKMIAANFSIEKQNLMHLINESINYVLTNKEFLQNVSEELSIVAMTNFNSTLRKENKLEKEIRNNLKVLTNLIQNMKTELFEKSSKLNESKKVNDKLIEENKRCLSSKEDLQEKLEETKETEEELSELKEEIQSLRNVNENMLKQILSIVERTSFHQNGTLETILKQTASTYKGVLKYIIEPTEIARNATLKSILKNRTKEESLITAAKEGNVTEMSLLLDYGANIEGEDNSEWKLKPLHWVSDKGHLKAATLLLLRGANVNARTFLNATALHVAVNKNHHNIIDILLKGGADLEARDKYGFTPLFRAVRRDCKIAKLLIERGANVSTTDDEGTTAVAMASECVRKLLCSKGAMDPKCSTEDETATTILPYS